jgi:3-oxocholest-4-en-26-oate---CoA ligase
MAPVESNLWTIFNAVADAVPDRDAIVWRGRRWSYRDLQDRAQRLAAVLTAHGLGARTERTALSPWEAGQDLVGLYLLNGPEFLEANLGGYAARTAPFNVNYRYVADELTYLLEDASTAAIVYHARFSPTLAEVLPRLNRVPLLLQVADESGEALLPGALDYEQALAGADPTRLPANLSPDDLYVLYTGGTTGMPKGTLWRQADIWMAALGGDLIGADLDADALAAAAAASPDQRVLPNAPFMHGAAQWVALRGLLTGGTVVVNGIVDRLDPVDVWQTIERESVGATLFIGEAFARPLIAELERGTYDTSSLRLIAVGGAVTSPETKARVLAHIPQVLIADLAGSSETGSALSQMSTAGSKPEAGVFAPNPDVAVLDADLTRRVEPGEDTIGWFAKAGRIPLGYLGDQAKTERTFPTVDGRRWSVPGDRARLRHDGMVELLGRDSVTINSGGEKIFAEEVEAAVLTHPDVLDAIVVGRPSERWGEEVVAVVQLTGDAGASDEDIIDAAASRIARYKLPKVVVRVPLVVRSPAGKADYSWARGVALDDGPPTLGG